MQREYETEIDENEFKTDDPYEKLTIGRSQSKGLPLSHKEASYNSLLPMDIANAYDSQV
jgi:hypothetical protein